MVLKARANTNPGAAGAVARAGGAAAVRVLLLLTLGAGIAGFLLFDLDRFLSLEYLSAIRTDAAAAVAASPAVASGLFLLVYIAVTALSLPGAAVMTLAGGALFGLAWGLVLVSFASSIGATLAMLVSRSLLRDWVQQRFGVQLESVNRGLQADGGFYLFSLRMVPLFPFFVVNLVMGLTPIRTWTFYWVSQAGMLAGTSVYVFAGTQLGRIASPADILSPGLIVAFSLLGVFPLIARKSMVWLRGRRAPRHEEG